MGKEEDFLPLAEEVLEEDHSEGHLHEDLQEGGVLVEGEEVLHEEEVL